MHLWVKRSLMNCWLSLKDLFFFSVLLKPSGVLFCNAASFWHKWKVASLQGPCRDPDRVTLSLCFWVLRWSSQKSNYKYRDNLVASLQGASLISFYSQTGHYSLFRRLGICQIIKGTLFGGEQQFAKDRKKTNTHHSQNGGIANCSQKKKHVTPFFFRN